MPTVAKSVKKPGSSSKPKSIANNVTQAVSSARKGAALAKATIPPVKPMSLGTKAIKPKSVKTTPTALQLLGVKLIVPNARSYGGIGVPKPLKGQAAVKAAREAGIITANGNLTKRYK